MDWKKKNNTIEKQLKDYRSSLTSKEWNYIINVLALQANNNTEGIVELNELIEQIFKSIKSEIGKINNDKDYKANPDNILYTDDQTLRQKIQDIVLNIANIFHALNTKPTLDSNGKIPLSYFPNSAEFQENIKAGREIKIDLYGDDSIINVDRNDRVQVGGSQPSDTSIQFWLDTNEYVEPTNEVVETPEIEPIVLQEEVVETPVSKLNE